MKVPVESEVLAGKYRVERILGKGGMGVVMAATHLQLGQRVAIKFLLENATKETISRFIREARAAVRLKSEHAARVLDVGDLPDGSPYMVMEYLEGNDLSHLVRSRGALPTADAVLYVLHTCEAMAEAHSIGIIHRDLKPANLFLTHGADGALTIKVLDFGISKTLEEDEMQLTSTTAILGSPLYMSPEQIRSARDVTVQSDIWSLGAILYQLLVGVVPFKTKTFSELILMVNMQPPPPMATLRSDVPPGLEAAALRCLEKKPEARFASVGELAWAIAEYGPSEARASAEKTIRTLEAAGVRVQRTNEISGVHPAPVATSITHRSLPPISSVTLAEAPTLVRSAPRSKGPLVMAGVAVGVVLAVTVVGLMLRSSSRSPELGVTAMAPAAISGTVVTEAVSPPTPTATAANALASASAAPEKAVVVSPPEASAIAAVAALKPTATGRAAIPLVATAAPTTMPTAKNGTLNIKLKQ